MVIRIFYIKGSGNSPVIDVGLRSSVMYHGNGVYNLKIVARDIIGKTSEYDKVEVIMKGDEDIIQRFYNHVKEKDIRQIKEGDKPKISELKEYEKDEPDWDYCLNATNIEQIYKSLNGLGEMVSSLENINTNLKKLLINMEHLEKT